MERRPQTPRREQKSILDFCSPLSAEDAERKAAEQREAAAKQAEQTRREKESKHDELKELKKKWALAPGLSSAAAADPRPWKAARFSAL